MLLCRYHHRALHEGGLQLQPQPDGELRFLTPDGRPIPESPPVPLFDGGPTDALTERLLTDGASIDPEATIPSWDGRPIDLGWAVEWLLDQRPPPLLDPGRPPN